MSLTIGVCGTQHPHGPGHLQALEGAAEASRLLIWDPDPAPAQLAAERSAKAEVSADRRAVLDPDQVDAVVCLLPTDQAGPVTLQAIQDGLYVYGDKPGARTAEEMAQIVAAAEQTGAHFCPCYPWRGDAVALEIKRLIQQGVLGDLWAFQANWITSQVALRGADNWLFRREVAGGGILSWLGCHWIDLLAFLIGPAAEVTAMVATLCAEGIDVEDTASVVLRQPSGAIGTIRAGYAHKPFYGYKDPDLCFVFEGSLGSIYWPVSRHQGYRLRTGHPAYHGVARRWVQTEEDPDAGSSGYSAQFLKAFLAAVADRSLPPATERDALYVLRVLEAAYTSSRERRHVML